LGKIFNKYTNKDKNVEKEQKKNKKKEKILLVDDDDDIKSIE